MAVIVAAKDCSLFQTWETDFQAHLENFDVEEKFAAYNSYDRMYRAALLFSLISLRKVADFAENRGRSTDIQMQQFGVGLEQLAGVSSVIDNATRDSINKAVAHLTDRLDPDADEMEELRKTLVSKLPIVDAIADKFFGMTE